MNAKAVSQLTHVHAPQTLSIDATFEYIDLNHRVTRRKQLIHLLDTDVVSAKAMIGDTRHCLVQEAQQYREILNFLIIITNNLKQQTTGTKDLLQPIIYHLFELLQIGMLVGRLSSLIPLDEQPRNLRRDLDEDFRALVPYNSLSRISRTIAILLHESNTPLIEVAISPNESEAVNTLVDQTNSCSIDTPGAKTLKMVDMKAMTKNTGGIILSRTAFDVKRMGCDVANALYIIMSKRVHDEASGRSKTTSVVIPAELYRYYMFPPSAH